MYTKEELEQMEPAQLLSIAAELGVEVSQDDELEKVVYEILDQAAIDSASGPATKRKRTRISKKDTDKVYTVNGIPKVRSRMVLNLHHSSMLNP